MDKIEKIRAEIERRKKICEGIFERESDTYYQGKAVAYGELLPFIDTLADEPVAEGLEEAAKEYAYNGTPDEMKSLLKPIADEVVKNFIAGAEWQKEQDEKEQADLFTIVALDAAQRAKEQMMKEAVEGIYTKSVDGKNVFVESGALKIDPASVKVGDKVKLIIVRSDETSLGLKEQG